MGAMSIKTRITWPNDVIYGADGHIATYKDLTVSSMRGYLIVLKDVQVCEVTDSMVVHLEELMENANIYGWEEVKVFHTA